MDICTKHGKVLKAKVTFGFGVEDKSAEKECSECIAERLEKQIEEINGSALSK